MARHPPSGSTLRSPRCSSGLVPERLIQDGRPRSLLLSITRVSGGESEGVQASRPAPPHSNPFHRHSVFVRIRPHSSTIHSRFAHAQAPGHTDICADPVSRRTCHESDHPTTQRPDRFLPARSRLYPGLHARSRNRPGPPDHQTGPFLPAGPSGSERRPGRRPTEDETTAGFRKSGTARNPFRPGCRCCRCSAERTWAVQALPCARG